MSFLIYGVVSLVRINEKEYQQVPFSWEYTANDFGLVASSPWTNIVEREYYDGSYTNTGNLANYFVTNGSLNLGATPGTLVLPISKPYLRRDEC